MARVESTWPSRMSADLHGRMERMHDGHDLMGMRTCMPAVSTWAHGACLQTCVTGRMEHAV